MLQREIQEQYWDFLLTPDLLELRNIAAVAELVIRGALFRRESRGLHYTADYPRTLKTARGTLLARGADGRPRAGAGSPVRGGS
jgi:L-aspartate oxidase